MEKDNKTPSLNKEKLWGGSPLISIIMGSTSDLPVMEKAMKFLDDMEIPFEVNALSGVIAANTTLPVIGVPIKGSVLDGVDALYSILQMPPGIPVATVAINGAMNAAILACQMISLADEALAQKMAAYKAGLAQKIEKANADLAKLEYKYKRPTPSLPE